MEPTNLAEVIQHIAKQEREKLAAQILEGYQKLITVSYDKAASYTTVIIFGGYAGFFAIWQLTREYLSKEQALWSALLIMISMLSFVLFEVAKMIIVSRTIFAQLAVLRVPEVRADPHRALKAINDLEESQRAGLGWFIKFWALAVFVALSGALSAAGILGYAFISGLAK